MRVLILNWRDVKSTRGGGAERVTHEVARRLVAAGNQVTWLSSAETGLPSAETIDGVRVLRRGSELTTRRFAPRVARSLRPDVIVEEINTLPYFATVWSRRPVLLFMNQLARDVWWYEAPLPLAAIGWASEPLYLQAYRHCDVVTVSRSSCRDLKRFGVGREVTVVPLAVDIPAVGEPEPRTMSGRLVAIGRLAPSKRYDHAIEALSLLRPTHPDARLDLIGGGSARERLQALAQSLEVADRVVFHGRVDEREKLEILDAADVLVGTSVREGWGLTVTEAAVRGIPAVVYDIPGFRDAVVDGVTGLTVPPSPAALATAISELLADHGRYDRLRRAAWERARVLTYDATAAAFDTAIRRAAARG
jgi:glycosyltransferase involved in cell wall biosynthesis